MDGFSRDLITPKDPEFKSIPPQIANDDRYMPHFKDCIGALDGTHIAITIPEDDQLRYRGRKGIPTTNVVAVCDFDMLLTYVLSGWEGSAHDSPHPPQGKYYLVDKGYPERDGYLTPYPKIRYHQSEFRGANSRGCQEVFNRAHSSLRSCIERAFGILKARWKILQRMPSYSLMDQNKIICSCFALHNYIRISSNGDPAFRFVDDDPELVPLDVFEDAENRVTSNVMETRSQERREIRKNITSSLMAERFH